VNKIRVLHFVWRLEVGGGIPNVQRQILKWMDRERFELHVCSVRPLLEGDSIEELGQGITFHALDVQTRSGPRARAQITLGLARVLRAVRPDVWHAYAGYAWLAIIPDIVTRSPAARILDIQSDPADGLLSRRNVLSQRFMVRRMGYYPVAHSRTTQAHVAEAFQVPADSIVLFPNGIDTASFATPKTPRHEWRRLNGISPEAPVVLNAARLVPGKNVALYVEVARRVVERVQDAVFLVAGEGPLKSALQRTVEDWGLQDNIRLIGFVEHLADAYHASDIFMSTSDAESFPLTILEAMAAARPVVATAAGGIVEQVADGTTGRLCPVGDAAALAAAVLEIVENRDLRMRMGKAAQERAKRLFDTREMVRQYENLYVRICQHRGPAAHAGREEVRAHV
jgi:glycosyltransferase involved in cell wall biosynthesis